MNNTDLLSALRIQVHNAAGGPGDKSVTDRQTALDYYFQRARGDEVVGRSSVVSGDVSAMVEAVLAQMGEAFSSDGIIEFCANSVEDEEQAQAEATFVTYKVMSENAGMLQILSAMKEALQLRNGVMKVWVDERKEKLTLNFENVEPDAIADMILPKPGIEGKLVAYDEDEKTATISETQTIRTFRSQAVPLENFMYFADHNTIDLQTISFCAERHIDPRSSLIERGFPKAMVDRITPYKGGTNVTASARAPGGVVKIGRASCRERV